MNQSTKLSGLQWGVVGLTVITAVIHLVLVILSPEPMFKVLFLLNAIGYIVLVAALYFLQPFAANRSMIRWVLLGFTAVTFILYFVFNWPDIWKGPGIVDKVIELSLIILLWLDR